VADLYVLDTSAVFPLRTRKKDPRWSRSSWTLPGPATASSEACAITLGGVVERILHEVTERYVDARRSK